MGYFETVTFILRNDGGTYFIYQANYQPGPRTLELHCPALAVQSSIASCIVCDISAMST